MPMHPAAPEDLPGLIAAYAHTAQAVVDLTFSCSERDFEKPTECPGWTVKDQLSHVVSLESALAGRPDPPVEVPDYPHLRNDLGRMMEAGVELRRPRPGKEIVAELQQVMARRLGQLRDTDLTEATMVETPMGEMTFGNMLRLRVNDIWCHEQDIRAALGRPGALDSPAAATFCQFALAQLPKVVVKRAQVEPGKVVMLELTGPVIARAGVRVAREDDGTVRGHVMFARGTDETGPIPVIGKTTSIQMSTEAFTRRAAGRRSTEELHYSVHGDEAVAKRVLDELVLTP